MRRNLLLLSLLCFAAPSRADDYASLKPLLGSWLVDRDCVVYKDKVLVVFTKLSKTMLAEYKDPKKPEVSWGKTDIVSTGEEDHYRVVTAVPNDKALKTLRISSVGGSLNVTTKEEDEDSLPNNYITSSSKVSVLSSLLTVRLRSKYKKATFVFSVNSPLGKQQCRGTGVKQPAAKK